MFNRIQVSKLSEFSVGDIPNKSVLVYISLCLGSLSCWNLVCRQHPQFFCTLLDFYFFRMSKYTALSIMPSINYIFPTHFSEMHPHRITDPSPCFTLGRIFVKSLSTLAFLHILWTSREPKRLILVSSDQITLFQNSFPLFI